ncbi:MAG: hypothetical protein ABI439_07950 [Rhodospirillales bacterium]
MAVHVAQAADARIGAFAGSYQGSGVADGRDSVYFTITARDLDVSIKVEGGGNFTVSWTTVIQNGGPSARPQRKTESVSLAVVDPKRPNVFRAVTPGDPMAGQPYYWARIAGQTLTVYALTVAPSGVYDLTSWSRTLTPAGMDLVFRRQRDGEALRVVKGKLGKIGQ